VILDTLRGGLPWLAAACVAVALSLGAFLSQLALTESQALQTAIVAALLRASAVFLIATQVISSTVRETDDKVLEMMLALPLARALHYAGRLAGFAIGAVVLAALFSLALAFWVPPSALVPWGVSLALELILVAAAALFFAMTLTRLLPAIAALAGLYLLGRSMTAIQAIASGPLADTTLAGRAARAAVDAVALVLPRLDLAARTEWLLYGAPAGTAFWTAQAGLVVYIALLAAAGLFDFQRRSL
jgi:ABC-type Na+ efflux pump permease subunit